MRDTMVLDRESAFADKVFAALADRTRRDILTQVSERRRSISELAQHYSMTLPAVSKHVSALEDAKLLRKEKEGRTFMCTIVPETFTVAIDQIEFYRRFWTDQLDGLGKYLDGGEMDIGKSIEITREYDCSPEMVFRAIRRACCFGTPE